MFQAFTQSGATADAEAIRAAVEATGDYSAALEKVIKDKQNALKATNNFSAGLKGLGNIAKSVGASLLTGAITAGISFAVSKGIEYLDKQINAVKYAKEALEEYSDKWEELQETQKTAGDLVTKYASDYERLSKGVNMVTGENVSLTDDEYNLFKQINTELADSALSSVEGITIAYDAQGQAIVRLSDQMDSLGDAYAQLEKQTNNQLWRDLSTVVENAHTALNTQSGWTGLKTYGVQSLTDAAKSLLYMLEHDGAGSYDARRDTNVTQQVAESIGITAPWLTVDHLYTLLSQDSANSIAKLNSYIAQQEMAAEDAAAPVRTSLQAYASLSSGNLSDVAQQWLATYISVLSPETIGQNDSVHLEEIVRGLITSLSATEAQSALEGLTANQSDFLKGSITYGQFIANGQEQIATFPTDEWPEEFQELLREAYGLDDNSSYDKSVRHIQAVVTDATDEWINSLTADQLDFATQIASGEKLTQRLFNSQYADYQKSQNYSPSTLSTEFETLTSVNDILTEAIKAQGYSASLTAEQYDKLVGAGEEYAACVRNTNGYMQLDIEASKALIAKKQEETKATVEAAKAYKLQKYSENQKNLELYQWTLENVTDLTDESTKALEDKITALESEQALIKDDIDAYNRLGSEIAYATSSYKKWLDAQDAPEAGDAYADMLTAMGQIQEGQKSGKVGTAKYKAAVELLVPDGQDVTAYVKTLEKYLTEDATGLQKFINDMFAQGFLSKDANGLFSFMSGTTVEDIAAGLGLTEELTQYMLQALQDYGWDVNLDNSDYTTDALLADYEAAIDKTKEAQAALDALNADANATAAEIAQAQADLAEAQARENELALQVSTEAADGQTLEEQLQAEIDRWQAAIAQMEALEIPVSAVIKDFTPDPDANNPNELVSNLAALIVEYDNAPEGEKPDWLVAKLQAYIDAYHNCEGTDPNGLVSDLEAEVTVTADDQVSAVIEEIENGQYKATVGVELDPEQKAALEADIKELQDFWSRSDHSRADEPFPDSYYAMHTIDGQDYEIHYTRDYGSPDQYSASYGYDVATGERYEGKALEQLMQGEVQQAKETQQALAELVQAIQDADGQITAATEMLGITDQEAATRYAAVYGTSGSFMGDLESLMDYLQEEYQVDATLGLNTDDATEQLTAFAQTAAKKDITARVKVSGVWQGITGFVGRLLARGTKHAKNEDAIVGEAGVETVLSNGQYYTVGHNGPELVHLHEGDQVLTAEETKKLFRTGGSSRKSGGAYAAGIGQNTVIQLTGSATKAIAKVAQDVGKVVAAAGTALSGGGKTTLSKTSNSTSIDYDSILEKLEQLHDWITRALTVAEKRTKALMDSVKDFVGYMAQNKQVDKALESTRKEIELNQQAYTRYMTQALDVQKQLNLSDEIVAKIQEGTIDIEQYDDTTKKIITEYQEWYNKAEDCKDTIEELREQEHELQLQRLDNIITDYDNRIDQMSDASARLEREIELQKAIGAEVEESSYEKLIANEREQAETLQKERTALEAELNSLIANGVIQVGSEEWHKYRNELEDIDSAINDATISMSEFADEIYNLKLSKLQIVANTLKNIQTNTESIMSLHDAQGSKNERSYYDQLIANGHEQIENLQSQNELIRNQMEGLDTGSEKYQEFLESLRANEQEINSIKVSQEQWNDAVRDLEIAELEDERDALQKTNDEYQKQLDMQEALADLAKAKSQRTKLVYRAGQGFVYESDQDAIDAAQKRVDELEAQARIDAIEDQIDKIEEGKADDNVWSYDGTTLLKSDGTVPDSVSSAIQDMFTAALTSENYAQTKLHEGLATSSSTTATQITIGDVIVQNAENADSLAKDIVQNLPNAILQQLNKN